jgi:hypothetical protein
MAKEATPRLVPLDEKPVRTRRSLYSDLVQEFAAAASMKYARVEGAKPAAIVGIKKALAKHGLKDSIAAYTSNGVVILEKK